MARTGRPSKLTPELAKAFCERLESGLSRSCAAAAVGVSKKTIFAWLRLGRRGGSRPHAELLASAMRAEAQFVADRLAVVVRAATPRRTRAVRTITQPQGPAICEVTERVVADWKAAAWLLRCKAPDDFGDDRERISRLRSEVAELRQTISSANLFPPSGDHGPRDRAGAVSGLPQS